MRLLARAAARAALLVLFADAGIGAAGSAHAEDAGALFQQALRLDLAGGAKATSQAFELYRQAAELGLPQAQFNVAVMLDSGRGVRSDMAEAALWYARAAAGGNPRAAFNLGQLYEAGQGVPQNPALARAWFLASGLPAARARAAALAPPAGGELTAPQLLAPKPGTTLSAGARKLELVWTAQAQPEEVRFFVEMRSLPAAGSEEIFSGFVDTSSIAVPLPSAAGSYAWRVTTVARQAGRYLPSGWSSLSVP